MGRVGFGWTVVDKAGFYFWLLCIWAGSLSRHICLLPRQRLVAHKSAVLEGGLAESRHSACRMVSVPVLALMEPIPRLEVSPICTQPTRACPNRATLPNRAPLQSARPHGQPPPLNPPFALLGGLFEAVRMQPGKITQQHSRFAGAQVSMTMSTYFPQRLGSFALV